MDPSILLSIICLGIRSVCLQCSHRARLFSVECYLPLRKTEPRKLRKVRICQLITQSYILDDILPLCHLFKIGTLEHWSMKSIPEDFMRIDCLGGNVI